MVINELLEIDHLEKRITESQTEITKCLKEFEKEYEQYLSEVHESWAPHTYEVEKKYDLVALRKKYRETGKDAYKYSVAMFNAMSRFYDMKWHPRQESLPCSE